MAETKTEHKHEHAEHKHEEKPVDTKKEVVKAPVVKKEEKTKTGPKKSEAVVNGRDLAIGSKHAIAICNMIRGKDVDTAIKMLEEVTKYKRAVPMRGEIPHRKGMMSGRYPIKASLIYIKLLKSLKSNAIYHELEIEKFKIYAMADVAPRPYKKFGAGRFKRSHVVLKLIPIQKGQKIKH